MSTKQQTTSTGSNVVDQSYATLDERKRKRMISRPCLVHIIFSILILLLIFNHTFFNKIIFSITSITFPLFLTTYSPSIYYSIIHSFKRMCTKHTPNRESARRSRMKKQQHLDGLIAQTSHLQEENKKLEQMIDGVSQLYLNFASENSVLRAQVTELTDRLQSLNSVLQIASEVSGMAFDIPLIPDSLLEPWQLPCPIQPIPVSADMFQY